jgi:hypothetical protein
MRLGNKRARELKTAIVIRINKGLYVTWNIFETGCVMPMDQTSVFAQISVVLIPSLTIVRGIGI